MFLLSENANVNDGGGGGGRRIDFVRVKMKNLQSAL
jgi:hypothetical protein